MWRSWERGALAAIVALSVGLHLQWAALDRGPLLSDAPGHLGIALNLREAVRSGQPLPDDPYPPLNYAVTVAVMAVVGVSQQAAVAGQALFLAVLLAATAWSGAMLGGPRGAILAALAAAGSPWLALFGRSYFLDFSVCAGVALAWSGLLASEGFRRPLPTLAFGVGLAMALLTKWAALFFLLGPCLLAWLQVLRNGGRDAALGTIAAGLLAATGAALGALALHPGPGRALALLLLEGAWAGVLVLGLVFRRGEPAGWRPGASLSIALSGAVMACLPWYVFALGRLWEKTRFQAAENASMGLTFTGNLEYAAWFLARSYWALPLWLALGCGLALARRDTRWAPLSGIAGLALGIALVAATSPPDPRYLLPALTFATPLAFAPLGSRTASFVPALAAVAVLSWLQAGAGTLGPPLPPGAIEDVSAAAPPPPGGTVRWLALPVAPGPQTSPSGLEEALAMARDRGWRRLGVCSEPGSPVMGRNFRLAAQLARIPVQVVETPWSGAEPAQDLPAVVVVVRLARGPRSIPEALPYLSGWEELGCRAGGSASRGARWCLYRRPP